MTTTARASKQAAEIFRVATPGATRSRLQVAEGDLVVSRVVARGLHAGELMGIPPTNKQIETDGIVIHRCVTVRSSSTGRVVDVARILQQIGVLPGAP